MAFNCLTSDSNCQRIELAKRLSAAKNARDAGQLTDCQRLVDGYFPRGLLEYLPAILKPPSRRADFRRPRPRPAKRASAAVFAGCVPRILR